jgi:phosphatidylglycerol:prolipoprotein diacylglycerol transferase
VAACISISRGSLDRAELRCYAVGVVPYVQLPVVRVLGQPIYPFTWLVGLGMLVCYVLAQRRVKAVGLYAPVSAVGLAWVTAGGFIGAHVFEVVAYYPERLLLQGPLTLLAIWDGISSFGGFMGGTVAFHIYCRRQGVWMLPYLDALVYGFAPGWIIARGGCFVSHDHPGLASDFFLAVAYPGGPRHDLGLYEMLLAAAISLVLYLLPRRRRFVGFHTALVLLLYAPSRFLLDVLRTGDRRYLGLTPAQYLCAVMLGIAVYLVLRGRSRERATGETAG